MIVRVWEGDKVKGTPLTLALLAASTLYVGRRCARRALRGRAGDGLALHRAILEKRGRNTTSCLEGDYSPAKISLTLRLILTDHELGDS